MPGRTNHAGRPLAADRRPGAAHGPVILPWLAAYAFGHGVDVTGEPLERGIASLEAHAQYLAGIPGHPPAPADDHRHHPPAGTGHGRATRGPVPGLGLPRTATDRGRGAGGGTGGLTVRPGGATPCSASLVAPSST